ncbi:hypothetical protein GCM10010218_47010 [Streptomyces mashuensis]|uniref:Secreted protein n=1 Tax=Streptomyces mashuensis TaxID=33904 RepID=A0A919EET0_9ACTN|nr:hypothetical protein [Streptomyces mashuensis]GHF60033.1 hypothetical protein GCM10010218_47010 [Streptomyces mashuensis]
MKRSARTALRTLLPLAGAAALALVAGPGARADAAACGGATCVQVEGSGRYVLRVNVSPAPDGDFFGHFRLSGAGLNTTSAVQHWRHRQRYTVALGRVVPAGSVICAEGWEHLKNDRQEEKQYPHGRACVRLHG